MKLTAPQFQQSLQQPGKTLALLLYGPNEGLVRHCAAQWQQALKSRDAELDVMRLEGDVVKKDPGALHAALAGRSLFGGGNLVVLSNAEPATEVILEVLPTLTQGSALLLMADNLSPRAKLRTTAEQHPTLAVLPCYDMDPQQTARTAQEQAREAGFSLSPDAAAYLGAHLPGDMGLMMQELGKLWLSAEKGHPITVETVEAVVGRQEHRSLSDIMARLFAGQKDVLEAPSWQEMVPTPGYPQPILRAMRRYAERLLEAAGYIQEGLSPKDAMQRLKPKVFFREEDSFRRALALWPPRKLYAFLPELLKLEQNLKRHYSAQDDFLKQFLGMMVRSSKAGSA